MDKSLEIIRAAHRGHAGSVMLGTLIYASSYADPTGEVYRRMRFAIEMADKAGIEAVDIGSRLNEVAESIRTADAIRTGIKP